MLICFVKELIEDLLTQDTLGRRNYLIGDTVLFIHRDTVIVLKVNKEKVLYYVFFFLLIFFYEVK
jgi:hypothetical protein